MICQTHHLISGEDECPICEALPAADPQLAAQGYTREQERDYQEYLAQAERDEQDRVASGGLLECPECGYRSVVPSSRWTANYGGGYDTAYECANPRCDYAEVCV